MKKVFIVIVSLLVFLINIPESYSAEKVIESPEIRIVIDGKNVSFSNNPVTVNYRTMLPLREILTKLGVQDESIIWDDTERSVTIHKDELKIYLREQSNTAFINDNPIQLDAAPVNYKSRVFIPVRFVADSLDKKVAWDEGSKTVLIKDLEGFNKVKELLEKSKKVAEKIKKYRFSVDADTVIAQKTFEMKGVGEVDIENSLMHTNMLVAAAGKEINVESFIGNNSVFSKTGVSQKWEKKSLSNEQFNILMNKHFISDEKLDILAAGLTIVKQQNPDTIVLGGDVFLDDVFKGVIENVNAFGVGFSRMNMEVCIDDNTYLTQSISMNSESGIKSTSGNQPITQRISCIYSDYNGSFDISIPEEAK